LVACDGGDDDDAADSGTGGMTSTGGTTSTGGESGSTGGASGGTGGGSGGSESGGSESGGSGGGSDNPCPTAVRVTWNEGGEAHHASQVVRAITGDTFGFNAVACEDDDQVIFKFLPFPLATGTYPLRYHLLGETGPLEVAAGYAAEGDAAFATNGDHTGELVITEVSDNKFSGTFHFEAIDHLATDDNVDTVSITDGVLTDVPIE
jgi:hypothetical protein